MVRRLIPERNHSCPGAAAILSSNNLHCLVSFLSPKRLFVNRGRVQKVSALLLLSFIRQFLEHLGQFVRRFFRLSAAAAARRATPRLMDRLQERNERIKMCSFVSGDSFVVNACLARKGLDDWLVKQKYYCTGSRLEQQDCHHKNSCGLTTRVSAPSARFTSSNAEAAA